MKEGWPFPVKEGTNVVEISFPLLRVKRGRFTWPFLLICCCPYCTPNSVIQYVYFWSGYKLSLDLLGQVAFNIFRLWMETWSWCVFVITKDKIQKVTIHTNTLKQDVFYLKNTIAKNKNNLLFLFIHHLPITHLILGKNILVSFPPASRQNPESRVTDKETLQVPARRNSEFGSWNQAPFQEMETSDKKNLPYFWISKSLT